MGLRHVVISGLSALTLATAATAAAPVAGGPVVIRDDRGDAVTNGLDITRASLQLASDGKLRATVTFAHSFTGDDLGGAENVPGGVCLRLWTTGQSPASASPDHLVCVSAAKGVPEGSVLSERPADLPVRTARAAVRRTSARTLVVRFAQTPIGRPDRIRFNFEATRPGCPRTSCIDTAPDAPRSAVLVIRRSAPGHP